MTRSNSEPDPTIDAAATTAGTTASTNQRRPRVLIVGGEHEFRTELAQRLRDRYDATHVGRLDEAQLAMAQRRFELLLLHANLPDGDGLAFSREVQERLPLTRTMILTTRNSYRTAVEAMRAGALDIVSTGEGAEKIAERVTQAMRRGIADVRREQKIRRLQKVCRDLDTTRQEISHQVDALCGDLVHAYEDMTSQINEVAMASEFRTLLRMELDVEDLLRTKLEYLLTKTGPTNAAVFLPDAAGRYGLGAYVNYDCPRESIDTLLTHLCEAICPQMADEPDLVAFDDADEFAQWIGMEDTFLANSQVIAFSCLHEGECLAVVVLFRSATSPFEPSIAGTLDTLRTIFAEQLRQVIKVHHRAEPQWPASSDDELEDYDDYDFPMAA